jgi:16S rRNA (cytidine1402-2'-O)-methyltransferase
MERERHAYNLYVVGPLGDLWQDVPLRAQRILQESSLVVARHAASVAEWLRQGGIRTPVVGLDALKPLSQLVEALQRGDVAWLIGSLEELTGSACGLFDRLQALGIAPLSVPGPSPVIAGLAISGLPADTLTMLGPLPVAAAERRALLASAASEPLTVVCEVDAERLAEALRDLLSLLGDRRVALYGGGRVWRGRASQAGEWPDGGRLTLAIEGAGSGPAWTQDRVRAKVRELLVAGASPRDVAGEVARCSGWSKREVYRLVVSVRGEG